MENKHSSFKLSKATNEISKGGRSVGKTARNYSEMIASGQFPSQINSFQKEEIIKMWMSGSTMSAIKKLQDILEYSPKSGKTFL